MKTRDIIYLIIFGAVILYCAKVLINASILATSDAIDAFYSILGWSLYFAGWAMFVGGNVAFGVKLVIAITHD